MGWFADRRARRQWDDDDVLHAFPAHAGPGDGWITAAEVARGADLSFRRSGRALRRLMAAGRVEARRGVRDVRQYRFVHPETG